MKIKFGQLLAIGALAVGAVPAFATTSVPSTIDYTASLNPTADDGTVLFHLYSTDTSGVNYSYTASLGLTLSQIQVADMTTTLTWNLTGLSGLPSSLVSSNNLGWGITALNFAGNLTGGAGSLQLATTVTSDSAANLATTTNGNLVAFKNNLYAELNQLNNTSNCATPGLCTSTSPSDTWYWTTTAGANLGSSTVISDGDLTSSLAFYLLSSSSKLNNDYLTAAVYAGTWSLNLANDTLTYTVGNSSAVPLPAAAWLLLSGVAGLGAIGRRRQIAAV